VSPADIQLRREECRHAVRTYLYDRQAVAQSAVTIHRGLAREFDFTQAEVMSALNFWAASNPPQLTAEPDGAGATLYFKITPPGILAHERGK
jgi:hypothetical protein